MRKFKFRLQSILDIRQKELENQQIILAKLFVVLGTQEQVLREMELSRNELNQELTSLLAADAIQINEICSYKAFLQNIANNIKMQRVMIESTNEKIILQQEEVTKAYKSFKSLEKLKESQSKAHYTEQEALEVKEIDDVVTARFARAM